MRDLNTAQQPKHQVMTRSLVTVRPEVSVKEALVLMLMLDINCLPVLDQDEILGIFTIHDGVRVLMR